LTERSMLMINASDDEGREKSNLSKKV
jgi:hypothetical protein